MKLGLKTTSYGVDDQSWLGSAHAVDAAETITLDVSTFTAANHYPNGYLTSGITLGKITASGKYGPYGGRTNEVQTITINATGGTWGLTFDGESIANTALAWNITAANLQTALEGLSNINPGDVAVTGGPGGTAALVVTFTGQYAGLNVPAITTDATQLTGGAGTAVVATTQAGGSTVSDGREVAAGHLLAAVAVDTDDTTVDVAGALFTHGQVIEANLPDAGTMTNGGIDAAAKTALTQIRYR